jgi:hypothetical protein
MHMAEFVPALTVGRPNTVTTTEFELVHPVAVIVSVNVYVVVVVGDTDVLEDVLE